ncbi:MAG: carbohydrate ABC transporter permease [Actinoallomurus sp.]
MTLTLGSRRGGSAETVGPSRPRRGRREQHRHQGAALLFLLPYLLFLLAFAVVPLLYGAYMSLQKTGGGFTLDNWGAVLGDDRLTEAVAHVGVFLLAWLPSLALLVVATALTLHARRGRFGAVMRFVYYLPGAVTGAAAALLWLFMISPDMSPFGPLLRAVGIHSATDAIAGSDLPFVLAVMSLAIHAGGWIVVLYGALVVLPDDLIEAAALDGCSAWQLAWRIKLPLIRRWVIFMLITCFAVGSQVFVEPEVMSTGAPGAISPTWSVNQLAYYYATQELDFGKASALSLLLLAAGTLAAFLLVFGVRFYRVDER